MARYHVNLDEAAVFALLNDPAGPVGVVIDELSNQGAAIARMHAPLQKPQNWSWQLAKSTSYEPRSVGYLKGKIRAHFPAFSGAGLLYGGVNAPYGPTLYLERPARQIHSKIYAFMTKARDTVHL